MSEPIDQDNDYCEWLVDLYGNGHISDFAIADDQPCQVQVYAASDPYYALVFTSRAAIECYIAQLQRVADEIWPE